MVILTDARRNEILASEIDRLLTQLARKGQPYVVDQMCRAGATMQVIVRVLCDPVTRHRSAPASDGLRELRLNIERN